MSLFARCALNKISAATVAAALMLQPLAAYAATITPTLAEIPLQGLNPVKPNIMYTMDDSGSMASEYLPDYAGEDDYADNNVNYCRDGASCSGGSAVPTLAEPPIRSSAFNKIYYDPTQTYGVGKRDDSTNLAYEKAAIGTWTQVFTDPYANYPSASNSSTTNLAPTSGTPTTALNMSSGSYPDTIWCWKTTVSNTDYQTADTNGSVCRRNGRAYSLITTGGNTMPAIAAGYNYPNNNNPPVTCSGSQKCKFVNGYRVYGYPYYYTISQVQFCSAKDANSWGTTPCTSRWDPTTYKYVRYGTGALTFDPAAFTRVDIKPVAAGGPAIYPSGRTYAQEIDNFAKWYAFDRTRTQAMKTAGGIAFSALDQNSRVGFNTLNSYTSKFINVADFTTANKLPWFTKFYSVSPSGITPSLDAMWRVGEYFSNRGVAAGFSSATDPLDPVTGKCQANYHLLSTDGYWNQTPGSYSGVAGAIGNQDLTVPTLPVANTGTGFTPGQPFPLPYREGPGANSFSNGMADIGMYYWIHDLRPTIANQGKDLIAPWQHVVFYGLSIGAQGTIAYAASPPASVTWPLPVKLAPSAIDDLWHAAVNSRGKYFDAQNPRQLAEGVVSALADFTDQSGTGTGVGLAAAQLSVTNQYGYKTSYEVGLWGDVKKYAFDINTGVIPVDANGNAVNAPLWSAAAQVDAQAAVTGSGASQIIGWDVNRKIVTINDATNAAVPFRLTSLSNAQQTSLNSGWSGVTPAVTAQQVLNYLRGDQSNEGLTTNNFRTRLHILGDIGYSGAVPVGPPDLPYIDAANPGYNAFKTGKASRSPAVYVGGNDGMLHAFDDTAANGGKETWAYIPKVLFGNAGDPNDTLHTPVSAFQLGALTYRRGGIPLFSHKFYVNATPRQWDIDFTNTNISNATGPPASGNDWRTTLVGGLGAGGRAVYALDVTNPVAVTDTEASVASSGRVLWEFTEANLGYVYDAPTLVKTYRYGWVALVASGYNNPGGKGFLYVLNPKTGVVLKKLALPNDTGTDTSPTGLSTVRAFVGSRKDPYVLQAYGGDLKGNVWRFDLHDADETKWKVELIAHLTDPSSKAQPITTALDIEIDQNNNVDRYLFVGTGKLLDQGDFSDTTVVNTMYVIKDGTRTTPEPAPATPYSRANLNAVTGTSIAGFATAPTGRGWYQDAANSNQKIVIDPRSDVQIVVFAFSYPSSDPCLGALSATLYARDLTTGNSVLESAAGSVVASADIGAGLAGETLIQAQPSASNSSPPVQVQVTTLQGQVYSFRVNLSSASGSSHRVSWRLLNTD